jgi:antirestriction protein ArdC
MLGGRVRKRPGNVNRWACEIIFWQARDRSTKTYMVFNVDQVSGDGLDKYRTVEEMIQQGVSEEYPEAEAMVAACGANIKYGGEVAGYYPGGDVIQMPERSQFEHLSAFYGTLFHELAHFAQTRVRWERSQHGQQGRAMEELVAEISAGMILEELRIPNEGIDNHASYLQSWLGEMKGDAQWIFKAAAESDKIVNWLLSFVRPDGKDVVSP